MDVKEYRRHVAKAHRQAARATTAKEREAWLKIARGYQSMLTLLEQQSPNTVSTDTLLPSMAMEFSTALH